MITGLELRMAWASLSWVVCSAASVGLLGWREMSAMFIGALLIGSD